MPTARDREVFIQGWTGGAVGPHGRNCNMRALLCIILATITSAHGGVAAALPPDGSRPIGMDQ